MGSIQEQARTHTRTHAHTDADTDRYHVASSSAGSNLKVVDTGRAQSAGISFWSCPSTFLALKVQLVVLVSAFVMVSTVWAVSCLLFFYSRFPRAQPFVKVWGRGAPMPYGIGATDSQSFA